MATNCELDHNAGEGLIDDDFAQAAFIFTQAIHAGPPTAALFAERAQAFIKMGNFAAAVADATRATDLDHTMNRAYLRKARACINLEQYDAARDVLMAGAALAPDDARFARLMKEIDDKAPRPQMSSSETKATSAAQSPPYPSSNKGEKDCDKMEARVEEDEKLHGDAAGEHVFPRHLGQQR